MKNVKKLLFLCLFHTSIHPYVYTSNFAKQNSKGQATVEYILFILIMLIACSGALKVIIIAWQHKFELISKMAGALSVLFC